VPEVSEGGALLLLGPSASPEEFGCTPLNFMSVRSRRSFRYPPTCRSFLDHVTGDRTRNNYADEAGITTRPRTKDASIWPG
jgi:hypothetical protein